MNPSDPRAGDCCEVLLWTMPETSLWSGRRDASAAEDATPGRAGTLPRPDRGWEGARRIGRTAVGVIRRKGCGQVVADEVAGGGAEGASLGAAVANKATRQLRKSFGSVDVSA